MKLLRKIRNVAFGCDWGPSWLDVPATWRAADGRGARVLIIDTGAPRFPGVELDACRSYIWSEEEVYDLHGHGTAVAGIVRDWAPCATVACYKAIPRSGRARGATELLAALREAHMFRPDVVVVAAALYLGASHLAAAVRDLSASGVLVVAGAGNDPAQGLAYPARFPEVLSVGACDRKGARAKFSPEGADILMPGRDIRVKWLRGGGRLADGTSLACAAAAGLAALAVSAARAAGCRLVNGELRHAVEAASRRVKGGA